MGAGIALQIAKRYPQAYEADQATPKGAEKLGTISYANLTRSHTGVIQTVVNAYTQRYPGRENPEILYSSIRKCLKEVKQNFEHCKIGLPLIGCGLAGGDWWIVEQIVIDELSDRDVTVVYYRPV
jgi:O-acetyl-ADP-ribose deacetylase (regulator of RNase III)